MNYEYEQKKSWYFVINKINLDKQTVVDSIWFENGKQLR